MLEKKEGKLRVIEIYNSKDQAVQNFPKLDKPESRLFLAEPINSFDEIKELHPKETIFKLRTQEGIIYAELKSVEEVKRRDWLARPIILEEGG